MNRARKMLLLARGDIGEINRTSPVITPTLGADLLTDGHLDAWTSATDLTGWTENQPAGSSVNQEGTVIHGGTYAARFDLDATNPGVSIQQNVTVVMGQWYQLSFWLKASGAGKTGSTQWDSLTTVARNPGMTYTQYVDVYRAPDTSATVILKRSAAGSASLYWDDATVKLATNVLVRLGKRSVKPGTYICHPTIVSGTMAGMAICYLNSTNYVLAYINTCDGKAYLDKYINGTWTPVINGAVTYSAAGELKVVVAANGTDFSLYYATAQVGTTQSITDTLGTEVHGFSTYSGNTVGAVTTSP